MTCSSLFGSIANDVGFNTLAISIIEEIVMDLYWIHETNIKHCHVSMLAIVGIVQF